MQLIKIMFYTVSTFICFIICFCYLFKPSISVNLGKSELFSDNDLKDAVEVIKNEFSNLEGCTLHSLSFAGDGQCQKEAESQISSGTTYDEYVVFDSSFRSPKIGYGAWTANTEYTWSWILGRNKTGTWELITYGYC